MKTVLAELHELINDLEDQGLTAEASSLQEVFVRVAQEADMDEMAEPTETDDLANDVAGLLKSHSAAEVLTEIAKQVNLADNIQTDNPENLYFNLYIRGTGQSNTAIELKAYELDSADSKADLASIIGTYVYNSGAQANNDGWIYDIVVDWEGWKLVSIPYSKFKPSSDLTTGGNGNRTKEPWKVTGMAVSLLSYPTPGLNVSADIDYVVISEGGPFVPKY